MKMSTSSHSGSIDRFTGAERLAHWNHALTFLVLLTTGAPLAFIGLELALRRETLMQFAVVHRWAAVVFTAVTIPVLLLWARQSTRDWVRSSFQFDADDRRFLALFWREFFGLKVRLPHQGKFNAGEKINSILQILGWPVMVSTGWLLFWRGSLPKAVAQWVLPVHSFTALLLGAVAIGHIYLAAVHPHARPGLSGMMSGKVPANWARSHYRKWYDRVAPSDD